MNAAPLSRQHITGLVLAGGRGSRMGGVDKGLQLLRGRPLAWHALQRLRPQVGPLVISANRHVEDYAALGVPVLPDTLVAYPGPLAGMLAALQACTTPWMATVPCDAPHFPPDLVPRLAAAAQAQGAQAAVAASPDENHNGGPLRLQPVFSLLSVSLVQPLAAWLQTGDHRVQAFMTAQRTAIVPFDDAAAFFNINTLEALRQAGDEAGFK